MTEKKPGEPDERARELIVRIFWPDKAAEYIGRPIPPLHEWANWAQTKIVVGERLLAAYREEIESRAVEAERERRVKDTEAFVREGIKDALEKARREGAREALERAASAAFDVVFNLDNEPEGLADAVALAIRALADQPEAEGKEQPMRTEEDILLELAWGVIANAGGGDWTRETRDWQTAAASWRDRWHLLIQTPQAPAKPDILDNHELRLVQLEENAFGGPAHPNPPERVMPLESKPE